MTGLFKMRFSAKILLAHPPHFCWHIRHIFAVRGNSGDARATRQKLALFFSVPIYAISLFTFLGKGCKVVALVEEHINLGL
jgi:hypothetical protein